MDFKKSLAFTTALSAVALLSAQAAVAAEKPSLRIYGYQETFMGVADVNDGTVASGTPTYQGASPDGAFNMVQYGELRFRASGTTDSGMKWGVYMEKGMDDDHRNKGLSADENNLWLEGSWGKLEIGGQDGAADRMKLPATKFDLLGGNILGAFVDNEAEETTGLRGTDQGNVMDTGDDSKFTYYTPRVAGFQGGISYVPRMGSRGTNPDGDADGGHEVGVGYNGKAGATTFKVNAAYSNLGSSDAGNDMVGWTVGGQVGFGAISLGASYAQNDDWREDDTENKSWTVGANYNGGKWEVSLIHVNSETELTTTGETDEYQETKLQGAYNLGGGLSASVGAYFFDLEDEGTTADDVNNDGTAVIGKLNARF